MLARYVCEKKQKCTRITNIFWKYALASVRKLKVEGKHQNKSWSLNVNLKKISLGPQFLPCCVEGLSQLWYRPIKRGFLASSPKRVRTGQNNILTSQRQILSHIAAPLPFLSCWKYNKRQLLLLPLLRCLQLLHHPYFLLLSHSGAARLQPTLFVKCAPCESAHERDVDALLHHFCRVFNCMPLLVAVCFCVSYMQASMWVDGWWCSGLCASVCVCVWASAAVALVHCVSRGYGILFLFLAASPSGGEPDSVNCALQWDTAPLSLWRMPASGPRLAVQLCICVCGCKLVCRGQTFELN